MAHIKAYLQDPKQFVEFLKEAGGPDVFIGHSVFKQDNGPFLQYSAAHTGAHLVFRIQTQPPQGWSRKGSIVEMDLTRNLSTLMNQHLGLPAPSPEKLFPAFDLDSDAVEKLEDFFSSDKKDVTVKCQFKYKTVIDCEIKLLRCDLAKQHIGMPTNHVIQAMAFATWKQKFSESAVEELIREAGFKLALGEIFIEHFDQSHDEE